MVVNWLGRSVPDSLKNTDLCDQAREKGSSTNHPNPLPAHAYPTKFFSIFRSLCKILKTLQIIENTRNIVNIALILRICIVKVSKIQVEREGGVGEWWVTPSTRWHICHSTISPMAVASRPPVFDIAVPRTRLASLGLRPLAAKKRQVSLLSLFRYLIKDAVPRSMASDTRSKSSSKLSFASQLFSLEGPS
jgi:hypothetical protein